jgi:hypothetical protein
MRRFFLSLVGITTLFDLTATQDQCTALTISPVQA